jgi:phage-related protein
MITLTLMLKMVGFRTTNNIQGGHPSYNIVDKLYVLKWKSDSLTHKISELAKCSLGNHKSNLSTAYSVIEGSDVTEFNIQSMTTYSF